jgi:hypothetical protein
MNDTARCPCACVRVTTRGQGETLLIPYTRGSVSLSRGLGDSLLPQYTSGNVFSSLTGAMGGILVPCDTRGSVSQFNGSLTWRAASSSTSIASSSNLAVVAHVEIESNF